MAATERRKSIISYLQIAKSPMSASALAKNLQVSRQVIVSDIALLRTAGNNITATPKGYVLESTVSNASKYGYEGLIACYHTGDQLVEELYTIVDYGAEVINVIVEHAIYGEISANLHISSRYDVNLFVDKISAKDALPLSTLTGGPHLHKIGCRDEETFNKICAELEEKGILIK